VIKLPVEAGHNRDHRRTALFNRFGIKSKAKTHSDTTSARDKGFY